MVGREKQIPRPRETARFGTILLKHLSEPPGRRPGGGIFFAGDKQQIVVKDSTQS